MFRPLMMVDPRRKLLLFALLAVSLSRSGARKLYEAGQNDEDDSLDCNDGRKIDDPTLLPFLQKLRGQEMIPARMKEWVVYFDEVDADVGEAFPEARAWNHSYLTEFGVSRDDQGVPFGRVFFNDAANVYAPRLKKEADEWTEFRVMYAEQLLSDAMEKARLYVRYEPGRGAGEMPKSATRLLQRLLQEGNSVTVVSSNCSRTCESDGSPLTTLATCATAFGRTFRVSCKPPREEADADFFADGEAFYVGKSTGAQQMEVPVELRQELLNILDWLLKRIGQRMHSYIAMAFRKNKFQRTPAEVYNKVNLQISKIKGGRTFEASKSAELIYNSLFDLNVYLNVTNTPFTFDKFHTFNQYLNYIGRFGKWQLDTTKYANFFEPLKEECLAFANSGYMFVKPARKIFHAEDGVYDMNGAICHGGVLFVVAGVATVDTIKSGVFDNGECPFDTVFVLAKKNFTLNDDLAIAGKNLVIFSPTWMIGKNQTIDLSGRRAGGQRGGDFFGFGVRFDRSELLTVVTNGGDGRRGRDSVAVVRGDGFVHEVGGRCTVPKRKLEELTRALNGSFGVRGGLPGSVTFKFTKIAPNASVFAARGRDGAAGPPGTITLTCKNGLNVTVPTESLTEANADSPDAERLNASAALDLFHKVVRTNSRRLSYDVLSFYKEIWTAPEMGRGLDSTLSDFLFGGSYANDSREFYDITSQILHSQMRQKCNMSQAEKILLDLAFATIRMKMPPEVALPSVIDPESHLKMVRQTIATGNDEEYFRAKEDKFRRIIEETNRYLKASLLPALDETVAENGRFLRENVPKYLAHPEADDGDKIQQLLAVNNLLRYLAEIFGHVQDSLDDFVRNAGRETLEETPGGRDLEKKLYFFRHVRNNITANEMNAMGEFVRVLRKAAEREASSEAKCAECHRNVDVSLGRLRRALEKAPSRCAECRSLVDGIRKKVPLGRARRSDDSCLNCVNCFECGHCSICQSICPLCTNCSYCPWCPRCGRTAEAFCLNCDDCADCPHCPKCPTLRAVSCARCYDCADCPDCPACLNPGEDPRCLVCTDCKNCSHCQMCKVLTRLRQDISRRDDRCSSCNCFLCPDCPQCGHYTGPEFDEIEPQNPFPPKKVPNTRDFRDIDCPSCDDRGSMSFPDSRYQLVRYFSGRCDKCACLLCPDCPQCGGYTGPEFDEIDAHNPFFPKHVPNTGNFRDADCPNCGRQDSLPEVGNPYAVVEQVDRCDSCGCLLCPDCPQCGGSTEREFDEIDAASSFHSTPVPDTEPSTDADCPNCKLKRSAADPARFLLDHVRHESLGGRGRGAARGTRRHLVPEENPGEGSLVCGDCAKSLAELVQVMAPFLNGSVDECPPERLASCEDLLQSIRDARKSFKATGVGTMLGEGALHLACKDCKDTLDFYAKKIAAEMGRCERETNDNFKELDNRCARSEGFVFKTTGCDPETFSRTFDEIRENFLKEFARIVQEDKGHSDELDHIQTNFVYLLANVDMLLQEGISLSNASLNSVLYVAEDLVKFKDLKTEYEKKVSDLHDFSETDIYDLFAAELSMQNEQLEVTSKWLKQLKKLTPWMTKVTRFLSEEAGFQEVTERVLEALRLVSEIYPNVRVVERHRELRNYIKRARALERRESDEKVGGIVVALKPVLRETFVSHVFSKAVMTASNWMFPSTKSFLSLRMHLDAAENETYSSRFDAISEELDLHRKSMMLYTAAQSSDENVPFYQWNVKTRPTLLDDLFAGKPVVLVSEILDGGKKNSLAAADFAFRFVAGRRQKNGTQEEIDDALKDSWLNAIHSGISYFKFGSRIYRRLTETFTFRQVPNAVKRERPSNETTADYVLSPYTTWILRMDPNSQGKYPQQVKKKIGTIELVGNGRYVVNCADIPDVNQYFAPLNNYGRRNEK